MSGRSTWLNFRSRRPHILCALPMLLAPLALHAEQDAGLPWQDARRFAEALEIIRAQYAQPVDDAELIDYAIRGMAAGLDPYSTYLAPDEYEQARIEAVGRYEGIGVQVAPTAQGYMVIAPFDGGPAQKAGLRPGDWLLRANGKTLADLPPAELDALLRGDAGTRITLTVQRDDQPPFDVELVRDIVSIPSVTSQRLDGGITYLRIANFSDHSGGDITAALKRIDRAKGLVIDLRNNAGGIVDGAVAVADAFIDEGTIVSTQGRAPGQTNEYTATAGGLDGDLPVVVLVNGGTASAAEILAGALQDHGLAVVLGTRTFGKAAVQSLIPLENGGALKLTTAHYRTPKGREIHGVGIQPDIEAPAADNVPPPDVADDLLVQQAIEVLRGRQETGS